MMIDYLSLGLYEVWNDGGGGGMRTLYASSVQNRWLHLGDSAEVFFGPRVEKQ